MRLRDDLRCVALADSLVPIGALLGAFAASVELWRFFVRRPSLEFDQPRVDVARLNSEVHGNTTWFYHIVDIAAELRNVGSGPARRVSFHVFMRTSGSYTTQFHQFPVTIREREEEALRAAGRVMFTAPPEPQQIVLEAWAIPRRGAPRGIEIFVNLRADQSAEVATVLPLSRSAWAKWRAIWATRLFYWRRGRQRNTDIFQQIVDLEYRPG